MPLKIYEEMKMGMRVVFLIALMFVIKSLVLFAAWNHVFVDMFTVLRPITIGHAFLAMLAIMAMSFSISYKES
jgi:hypothetical protein